MLTKSQFMQRKKIRNKSKSEKNRLWKAYINSNARSTSNTNKTVGFRAKQVLTPTGACVLSYSRTLLDPFTYTPKCFPYPPALASQKFSVQARITVKVGQGGVGYIVLLPSANNDENCIFYTGSAATINSAGNFTYTGTGINGAALTKNPYTDASFAGGDVQARLTSAGIRLISTTSELYRNGSVCTYIDPDHKTASNFTVGELYQSSHASVLPHDNREYMVTYKPATPSDFNYGDATFGYSPTGNVGYMLICIDASNSNEVQSFNAEVVVHYELIGRTIYSTTTSECDIQNVSKVISNASDLDADASNKIIEGKGQNYFSKILSEVDLFRAYDVIKGVHDIVRRPI